MTRLALPALVLTGLLLTACTARSDAADVAPVSLDADAATIAVDDDYFEPVHALVPAGTTVVWEWRGQIRHNVVGEGFQSEVLREGTFSHTFTQPGTYAYSCTLHRNMTGVITVE